MDRRNRYEEIGIDVKNYLAYLREVGIESIPANNKDHDSSTMDGTKRHGEESKPPQSVQTLESLREKLGDCKRCKLHKGRTHIVFGIGNPHAKLVFVGEGPGRDEDLQGEPFVGRAGQLLTKIINAMGLKRSDVYICNVVKCRPPGNRNPEQDEIATCLPFLEEQIGIIRPKVIVALGTHAAQTLIKTDTRISTLRGQFYWYRESVKVMPTYHPAYLLRNESKKKEAWEDIKKVMAELRTHGVHLPSN